MAKGEEIPMMQVEATKPGFVGAGQQGHLVAVGDVFEIPTKPTRKVDKDKDDELTQSIAKNGEVPRAFSSAWMKPVDEQSAKEKAPESKGTDKEGKTVPSGGKASAKEKI